MLTLETLAQLQTPDGAAALAAARALAPNDASLLSALEQLRKSFPPALASAALETVMLRQRARTKFSRSDEMFFTREALEQASGELVARHRARRYGNTSAAIYDICCSIGGDALGLATTQHPVVGIDIDPLRLAMAEVNLAVYNLSSSVDLRLADARMVEIPHDGLLFFDPARRRTTRGGSRRRVFNPDDYEPPLSLVETWRERACGFGVKVAPGIDYDALPYDCEVEIVSVAGEVKEACLWFGDLRQHTRSATLLTASGQVATLHETDGRPVPAIPPLHYLYEPDGAVIRAHLVEQLAILIGAAKIDDDIALLTSDTLVETPFARAFEVHEVLPFNLKRLRTRLRELEVGSVVIKKRGSPLDPQELEQQLRLVRSHPRSLTLVLTHVLGQPSVVLCAPVPAENNAGRGL